MAIGRSDRAIEILVFGLVGGATGVSLGLLWRAGFAVDSLLSFLGAVLGAAATVAGAVWLNDRTANKVRQQEAAILVSECEKLRSKALAVTALRTDDGPWPDEYRSGLHELRDISSEVPSILGEALEHGKELDFRQRVKIKHASIAITEFHSFHEDVFGPYDEDPMDERTWESVLGYMLEALTDLLESMKR